ncbi:hypothetical protein GOEFS_035_00860 [Gordonia effusa NBRC 100432]|uniref:DUF1266 domain-containing protein n=1 Tax=Gordonia effusa NBRC 100432 TaxID=1077974 RepID=H0QXK3_9ACTN|nr:DUF1266 domain-containing protein [Gordonia effusa]GAB17554.1 hypothetical protein GOEFS_035_00860 [Gordonia effusa NBRC 100432]
MTSGFASILTSAAAPTHGPAAAALALGAPLAVEFGVYWNSPERPGAAPGTVDATVEEKLTLARRWQITSADSWFTTTDRMIRGEHIRTQPAETALDIRDEVLERSGDAYLDIDDWLSAVDAHATKSGWDPDRSDLVMRLAVKAFYAEQQLATDGLLPAGQHVVTMFAHDLTIAAYLTQAGARMGFTNPSTVGQMTAAIGHNAAGVFTSWETFAASYAMAATMLYGGYPVDGPYTGAVAMMRLLTTDPLSPWTNIPFPTGT